MANDFKKHLRKWVLGLGLIGLLGWFGKEKIGGLIGQLTNDPIIESADGQINTFPLPEHQHIGIIQKKRFEEEGVYKLILKKAYPDGNTIDSLIIEDDKNLTAKEVYDSIRENDIGAYPARFFKFGEPISIEEVVVLPKYHGPGTLMTFPLRAKFLEGVITYYDPKKGSFEIESGEGKYTLSLKSKDIEKSYLREGDIVRVPKKNRFQNRFIPASQLSFVHPGSN